MSEEKTITIIVIIAEDIPGVKVALDQAKELTTSASPTTVLKFGDAYSAKYPENRGKKLFDEIIYKMRHPNETT